jgi:hypothetical protein
MASEQTGVTVTLKGGGGYDAPWIVLHGADGPDIVRLWSSLVNAVSGGGDGESDMASIVHTVGEANKLSAVKAVLGATEAEEVPTHPEPPVPPPAETASAALASPALIAVAAKKSGKTVKELTAAGTTTDEAKALIQGGTA